MSNPKKNYSLFHVLSDEVQNHGQEQQQNNIKNIYQENYIFSLTIPWLFQMLRLHNTAMGMDTSAAMAEMWKEGKVKS